MMMQQQEQRSPVKKPHNVIMENRQSLTVSGITDIDRYDEQTVVAFTQFGTLTITGRGLHVNKLSVETGELSLEGDIRALTYGDQVKKGSQNVLSKLFR